MATASLLDREDGSSRELDVVRMVDSAYRQAEELAGQYPEMAVVRAVSAFEVFIKRAFLEPYLRRAMPATNPELVEMMIGAILHDSQRWRTRLVPLLSSLWSIEAEGMPLWREMGRAWKARNAIVHECASLDAKDAARHVSTCIRLTRALLVAGAARAQSKSGDATDESRTQPGEP